MLPPPRVSLPGVLHGDLEMDALAGRPIPTTRKTRMVALEKCIAGKLTRTNLVRGGRGKTRPELPRSRRPQYLVRDPICTAYLVPGI